LPLSHPTPSRNVDWNKNSTYSGTVSAILRVVDGCSCSPPTTKALLKDNNDATFMDTNMASFIAGAGDAGQDGPTIIELMKSANPSLTKLTQFRDAISVRDAELAKVDMAAKRRQVLAQKARDFQARTGVTQAEQADCQKE
jgi:hypothetical protein